jgi:uncharacterized protein YggE
MRARPIVLSACALALGLAAFTALRPGDGGSSLPAALAAPAQAGDDHTLTFSGTGSVDLHPDTATVQLTTVGDAATSQAALNQTSDAMTRVIAAIKGLTTVQISDNDLQTGDISSYQDWDKPREWHAAQTLTVTLHDPSQAGQVIAAGNGAGADQVEGPDYSVQDQRDAYRTALRDALTDARGKADAVAQAMGGSVSGVLSVTEQDDSAPTPIYAMASKAADGASGGTQVPPTEQGSLTVSASVQVVFAYAG